MDRVDLLFQEHAALGLEQKSAITHLVEELTEKEKGFVLDHSKKKAALCGRRAGKTHGEIVDLVVTCLSERCETLYIALTYATAHGILWRPLVEYCREHGIDIKENRKESLIAFPNGSIIYVRGADKEKEIEKFRGFRFRKIVLDESGSFPPYMRRLILEVLLPTLAPRIGEATGTFVATGTPPRECSGMFYDITTGKEPGWSVHRWTILDNPHMDGSTFIEEWKKEHGLGDETPEFQREIRGIWVRSTDELVYKFDYSRNALGDIPDGTFTTVLGMDIGGTRDKTTFAVASYRSEGPELYFRHIEGGKNLGIDGTIARIRKIQEQFGVITMVADCGALGVTIVDEIRRRGQLSIQAAKKTEKMAMIALLNNDLRTGRVKVPVPSPLVDEWGTLQLTEDGLESPKQSNDYADAALYCYRHCRQYLGRAPEPFHVQTPDEHAQAWIDRLMAQAVEEEQKDKELTGLLYGATLTEGDLLQ